MAASANPYLSKAVRKYPFMIRITREKFVDEYAFRSLLTVEKLTEMGLVAVRCGCQEHGCRGWKMVNAEGEKVFPMSYRPSHN